MIQTLDAQTTIQAGGIKSLYIIAFYQIKIVITNK